MAINWIKRVFVLATILAVVLLLPGIASAAPTKLDFSKSANISQAPNSSSETNLTPQHRQQLQAVRQRRNRDIKAMLDSSQRAKVAKSLHAGNSFNQALESLDLQPDQQEMLKAIVQISNLKIKAISARFLHN
jgi:predicted transglutaminase-like cysteine proteinase